MSDPQPLSDFVKTCQDLLEKILASTDSNERAMYAAQLRAVLVPKKGK